jgi:hypothetical protein
MVAAARREDDTADAEFATAFDILERLGSPAERSRRAHAFYADVLEGRGEVNAAIQQLKRALASSGQWMNEAKAAIA